MSTPMNTLCLSLRCIRLCAASRAGGKRAGSEAAQTYVAEHEGPDSTRTVFVCALRAMKLPGGGMVRGGRPDARGIRLRREASAGSLICLRDEILSSAARTQDDPGER